MFPNNICVTGFVRFLCCAHPIYFKRINVNIGRFEAFEPYLLHISKAIQFFHPWKSINVRTMRHRIDAVIVKQIIQTFSIFNMEESWLIRFS